MQLRSDSQQELTRVRLLETFTTLGAEVEIKVDRIVERFHHLGDGLTKESDQTRNPRLRFGLVSIDIPTNLCTTRIETALIVVRLIPVVRYSPIEKNQGGASCLARAGGYFD